MAKRNRKTAGAGARKPGSSTRASSRARGSRTSGTRGKAGSTTIAGKARKAAPGAKKQPGDVLGISRARVPAGTPRATTDRGGRPKGVELGPRRRGTARLKPMRVKW